MSIDQTVTPDRERTIERICQAALDHLRSERDGLLAQECGDDEQLRREIECLLAHSGAAAAFLEAPALAVVANGIDVTGSAWTSGQRLGNYIIVSALGSGGMGEVYRALDTTLGREVAIKVLPTIFTNDPDRLARFSARLGCWRRSTIRISRPFMPSSRSPRRKCRGNRRSTR